MSKDFAVPPVSVTHPQAISMASRMAAYVMSAPGCLALSTVAKPEVIDGTILLKTRRVSVCATDVSYYKGHLSPPAWPVIPGHEYIGEVVENRSALSDMLTGDLVTYWGQTDFGGLAEYRLIRPISTTERAHSEMFWTERDFVDDKGAAFAKLSSDTPLDDAPLIEPTTAVLRSLMVNPAPLGGRVLVMGAGTCGLIASQVVSKLQGAQKIYVMDKNSERLKIAQKMVGCTPLLLPEAEGDIAKLVENTRGSVVDYVFDALPDISDMRDLPDARRLAMQMLEPGGKYVVFGATERPQAIDTWLVLSKGLRLRAAPFDVRRFSMWSTARVVEVARNLLTHRLVTAAGLTTHFVSFGDEKGLVNAFECHAVGDRMKTVVVFD